MSKKILLIFVAFTAMIAVAQTPEAEKPLVRWLETTHDFGAFNEDLMQVSCVFRGINESDTYVTIVSARANCGCTVPAFSKEPVAPGDTLRVSVAYRATGRPGKFEKKVYVTTMPANGRPATFRVKGSVIGSANTLKSRYPIDADPIRLSTNMLTFGNVTKGSSGMAILKGYNASSDSVVPHFDGLSKDYFATLSPNPVPPGEVFAITLNMDTGSFDEYGLVTDSISFVPDADSGLRVPVSVVAILNENFKDWTPEQLENAPHASLETQKLDFGHIDPTSEYPLVKGIRITNTGKSPLSIRRAFSPEKAVSVSTPPANVDSGKEAVIEVRVIPALLAKSDMLNARITIITNDPDNPTRIVRVVGQISEP